MIKGNRWEETRKSNGVLMKQKRWNPEKVELKPVIVTFEELELKFAALGKILYDSICQRLKESQNLHPGTIQQVQEIELKRTGTND